MSSIRDSSFTFGVESTWNTAVTPTRAIEWLDDSTFEWDAMQEQGMGLRIGTQSALYERRRAGLGQGSVTLKANILTKGFGQLLRACFGTGVSTVVTSPIYQQYFTLTQAVSYLPSYTLQLGLVDTGGTSRPHTFPGAVVKSFELDIPGNGLLELTVEFLTRYMDTATALTAVTGLYPAQAVTPVVSPIPLMGRDALTGGVTFGGTLVLPTATTLASGGTAYNQWRSINIKVDNGLSSDDDDQRLGGWNRPTTSLRSTQISGSMNFTGTAERDAFLAQSVNSFSATLITPELIDGTTYATMQIAAPNCMINSGGLPSPSGEGPTSLDLEMEALASVASPIALYGALVTSDTAL